MQYQSERRTVSVAPRSGDSNGESKVVQADTADSRSLERVDISRVFGVLTVHSKSISVTLKQDVLRGKSLESYRTVQIEKFVGPTLDV